MSAAGEPRESGFPSVLTNTMENDMQIKLILRTKTWMVRTPQSGSHDGWSSWEVIGRLSALGFLEMGWSYEVEG